ncbi:MAG: YqaA family protein [Candidatus Nanoarchaeia archaeon]
MKLKSLFSKWKRNTNTYYEIEDSNNLDNSYRLRNSKKSYNNHYNSSRRNSKHTTYSTNYKSFLQYIYNKFFTLFSFKLLILCFILLLLYVFHQPLVSLFYSILYQYPPLASLFSEVLREWHLKTLRGLLFIGFLSTLFFVSIPSELLFLQYVMSDNYIILIVLLLVIANCVAMFVNYIIGLILGRKLLQLWLKQKFYKYEQIVNRWGGIILILGNILPSPIEFISIIYGTSKYPILKYLYFVGIARAIKYSLLLYIFTFYPQYISMFIMN